MIFNIKIKESCLHIERTVCFIQKAMIQTNRFLKLKKICLNQRVFSVQLYLNQTNFKCFINWCMFVRICKICQEFWKFSS